MDWLRNHWQDLAEAAQDESTFVGAGWKIWSGGGWAMFALAFVSIFIFAVGMGSLMRLLAKRFGRIREDDWREWIHERGERAGPMGKLFDHVDEVIEGGKATVHDAFDEIRAREVEPFERDLRLMKTAVTAAPLVGLLGTVTGMLSTFGALSAGGGGDKTMAKIAEGISEALYTTETGLVIALPGLFFHYLLSRRYERYRAFLGHVEAVWAQEVIRDRVTRTERRQRELVRSVTERELERIIRQRVKPAGA